MVVSVFCKARFLEGEQNRQDSGPLGYGLGDLFGDSDQSLVGFGRAVSDCGLTASIHDVVVKSSFLSINIAFCVFILDFERCNVAFEIWSLDDTNLFVI